MNSLFDKSPSGEHGGTEIVVISVKLVTLDKAFIKRDRFGRVVFLEFRSSEIGQVYCSFDVWVQLDRLV